MIRIGTSWKITPIIPFGYVDEVRRHWFSNSLWDYKGAAKQCLDRGSYLIFNQCLGYNKTMPHPEYIPTEQEWKTRTEENVQMLKSIGATKNNTMLTLINEPTKYFRVENGYGGVSDLIKYTNWMYEQVADRFDIGSGNMEFYDAQVLGDWLRFLCRDGKFKYLLIHIQNSCDTDEHTRKYTDYAKGLADLYGKKLSCTEAMHTGWDMAKESDYNKLINIQLFHAIRIECQDFCVICTDINSQAAEQEIGSINNIRKTCFKIGGILRSNYLAQLKILADNKHPVPNIKEDKGVKDGMILQTLYDKEYEIINDVKFGPYKTAGYLVEWVQMILKKINNSEGAPFYEGEVTGAYDNITKIAVESFQKELGETGYPNITVDGKWGRKMYGWASEILIEQDSADGLTMDRLLHKWASPRK